MSVYVTGLEMDSTRTADATYTGKIKENVNTIPQMGILIQKVKTIL